MMSNILPNANSLLSPAQVAAKLPSRPLFSAGENLWDRALIQRFKHPPSQIDLPPAFSHMIVLNLRGPTLIEQPIGNGRISRRWTDAGHLSLTPAGQPVQRRLIGRPDILLLHIVPELVTEVELQVFGPVDDPGDLPPQLAVANEQLDQLGRLLLTEASGDKAPGGALIANSLVRSLIVQLLRRYKHGLPPPEIEHAASADPRISRVLSYMREHFQENITAEQLAGLSGASQSSFSRLFREAVGRSAYQHLLALRLEHALKLLEETALPVTEIAFECGFGQPTHFATLFRERFGMGPRDWRRANTMIEAPRRMHAVDGRLEQ